MEAPTFLVEIYAKERELTQRLHTIQTNPEKFEKALGPLYTHFKNEAVDLLIEKRDQLEYHLERWPLPTDLFN